MVSMRALIWSAVAWGSCGPPQERRSSAWMMPWDWPVRWLQAPTRPFSSLRRAARAWRLTGGVAAEAAEAEGVVWAGAADARTADAGAADAGTADMGAADAG